MFADRKEVADNIRDYDMWMHGMIVNLDPVNRQIENIFYCKKNGRLVLDEDIQEREGLEERSRNLKDVDFVEKEWKKYCELHKEYLSILELWSSPPYGMIKKVKYIIKKIARKQIDIREYLRVYDYLYCEAHEELIKYLVKEKIREKGIERVSDH